MPRTDLYVNLSITGELAPFRIVAHDGSGGYKQATAATEALVGTADELGKQPNGGADVAMSDQPEVEAGAAVAAGDPLTSDAQGRAVKATSALPAKPPPMPERSSTTSSRPAFWPRQARNKERASWQRPHPLPPIPN